MQIHIVPTVKVESLLALGTFMEMAAPAIYGARRRVIH